MKKIFPILAFLTFLLNANGFCQGASKVKIKVETTTQTSSKKLTEEQKITHLIKYVSGLDGATFIRNGDEYPAKDAAEHLQMKRRKAGTRVTTAREFIDGLASESYISGKTYQIRFKDGKTYNSRDVLMKELARLEKTK